MSKIKQIKAREVLDSRAKPTHLFGKAGPKQWNSSLRSECHNYNKRGDYYE